MIRLVFTAFLVSSCAAHRVDLAAPPSTAAPLADRVSYFEKHRPASMQTRPLELRRPWDDKASLALNDGTIVEDPTDLLEVVDATSPTAHAIDAANDASLIAAPAAVVQLAGLTTSFVGTGMLVIMLVEVANDEPTDEGTRCAGYSFLGMAIGGVAVAGIAQLISDDTSTRAAIERETAFLTYESSLLRRLGLSRDAVRSAP